MWLLDDGPLGTLAQAVRPALQPGVLHVGETVAAAAALDRSGRRGRLISVEGAPGCAVHEVRPGTEAWDMLFRHLRARYADATADFGEHEAIALCACDLRAAVFVTADKTAALLALSEFGSGRVASPFDLWEDLRARGMVDPEDLERLRARTFAGEWKIPGLPWRLKRT